MIIAEKKNLDKYGIFTCEELSSVELGEKFQQPIIECITHFVWRSKDQSIGFEKDPESKVFVKALIKDKLTILFPRLEIGPDENEKFPINSMYGITFLNSFEEIKQEQSKLANYHAEVKRNLLYQRYNKPVLPVYEPFLLRWFDETTRKYTVDFTDYVLKNKLKFILWAHSEWGTSILTYTSFTEVLDKIRATADNLNMVISKVADARHMPYY